MTITVVSPNTHKELTTLIQVKTELDITDSINDGILASFIQSATDSIEFMTGRQFAKEQVTETFGSDGSLTVLLERTPIISIDTVKRNGSSDGVGSSQMEIRDADAGIVYRNFIEKGWDDSRIKWQNIESQATRWKKEEWELTYTAGYNMPGSTDQRNLPFDLERAAVDMVKTMWFERKQNPGVAIRKVGDASETKFLGLQKAALPPSVQITISRWTRPDLPK